jgi:hypothetical protein
LRAAWKLRLEKNKKTKKKRVPKRGSIRGGPAA